MRKAFTAVLAAIMCASAAPAQTPGYNTPYSSAMPPERYRGDGAAVVFFVSDVEAYCGPSDPGKQIIACARRTRDGTPVIVMPNPRYAAELGDPYAVVMSHELAHAAHNWGANHES